MSDSNILLAREILDRLARLDEKQDKILESTTSLRVRMNDVEQEQTALHERIEPVEEFVVGARQAGRAAMWLVTAIAGIVSFVVTTWYHLRGATK